MKDSRREDLRNLELIVRYRNGDLSALNDLVIENERLVRGVTRKLAARMHFKTSDNEFEDLLQEGRYGLLLAVDPFDSSKSQFTSHAYFWIASRVSLYLNTKIGTISVPCDPRVKSMKLKDQAQRFRTAVAPGGTRPKSDPLGLITSVDSSELVAMQEEREIQKRAVMVASQSLTPTQKSKVLGALKNNVKIPTGPKRRAWAKSMDCAVSHIRGTLKISGEKPKVKW